MEDTVKIFKNLKEGSVEKSNNDSTYGVVIVFLDHLKEIKEGQKKMRVARTNGKLITKWEM